MINSNGNATLNNNLTETNGPIISTLIKLPTATKQNDSNINQDEVFNLMILF
jgi:hypothetical protein